MIKNAEILLPAIAYGDAAGLPVETKSASAIEEAYGEIDSLLEPTDNPFYEGGKVGSWSDDTQLSLAVTRSLVEANDFSMETLVRQHISEYEQTQEHNWKGRVVKSGWGRSTQRAIERLIAGVDPAQSGEPDGAGNGVVMKLAPLAYWHEARDTDQAQRYEQYDQLTDMTHDGKMARLCTRVHADILSLLMKYDYTQESFNDVLQDSITRHENILGIHSELSDITRYLQSVVTKETILEHTDRKGFYVPQTLAMAYGAFVMHQGDFTSSVYEAVNLGGDTDSNASIVAAMSTVAAKQIIMLPDDSIQIDRLHELQDWSVKLASVALKGGRIEE